MKAVIVRRKPEDVLMEKLDKARMLDEGGSLSIGNYDVCDMEAERDSSCEVKEENVVDDKLTKTA